MDFSLPIQNSTLVLTIILGAILLSPMVFRKLRIPSIVGLILAGTLLGPHGAGILAYSDSIKLMGQIGLLYIMFLSGIEIDINDFKRNRNKSLVFGLYTFIVPMVLGILSGIYILNFSFVSSVLLASMYASHTLMTYPIVSRYGLTKNQAVNITIGGTIVTVLLALLILAGIAGYYKGTIDTVFWLRLCGMTVLFCFIVMWVFPRIAQYFFKHYSDSILQFVFVMALVACGSFLAQLAGLEAILGAFSVGLSLNKLIPNLSPLMNRINFVGNALFIPLFLISVGMLVDFRVFFNGYEAVLVAAVMTVVATFSKWLAAWMTQKTFGMARIDRKIIFGLSNAQAAATLAAVMIGYEIILPSGERLLNENVLNGTIVMILFTCAISSFVTEHAAQQLSVSEAADAETTDRKERMLIPIANPATCDALMELAVLMVENKAKSAIYALSVNKSESASKASEKLLERAAKIGASSDNPVNMISHIDANIANGIETVVNERDVTDIVVGLHRPVTNKDTFFGEIIDNLLKSVSKSVYVYKNVQPINTIKRFLVAVPANAEQEAGFIGWFERIRHLSKQIGAKVCFYANEETTHVLKRLCNRKQRGLSGVTFAELEDWEDFLIIAKAIKSNELLVIISARKQTLSYNRLFEKIPYMLSKFFTGNSYLVLFPRQDGTREASGQIFNTTENSNSDFNLIKRIQTRLKWIFRKRHKR